jgi:hypothetical protein
MPELLEQFDTIDTIDTNDEYVITTLMNDPSLNTIFTLDNYNSFWDKNLLIGTIKEILANGTSSSNPLTRVTLTPIPVKTFSPGENKIEFLPKTYNRQNNMNIYSTDVSNTIIFNGSGKTKKGSDGYIGMYLENTFIKPGSSIDYQYIFPHNKVEISNGNGENITMNDGNTKCIYKKKCTKKHFYRPNCSTKFVDNGDGNGTQCSCTCSSEIKFNDKGEPHSHCETKDFSNNIINSLNLIHSVNVNIPVSQDITLPPSLSEILTYDPNIDYLCELIADYYILLIQQKNDSNLNGTNKKRIDIENNSKQQSYQDSNILYQSEYLKLINISVGIIASSFIIYSIL